MQFLFLILPLFYSACSVLPIAIDDYTGGINPPPVEGINPPPVEGINPPPVGGVDPPPVGGVDPPPAGGVDPPPVLPDEVERFHRANAGKYFAFEVYRNSSADNMAEGDNPSAGTVAQFLLFRFNGDGTLQSVWYSSSPFNSSRPDTDLDPAPAFYSKETKTYGETLTPIDPDNPNDPNRQWGIRKVRFINNFTRVQIAEDILGQGDWTGGNLVDVPLVIGTKTEVFAQYGMP